MTNDTRGCVEDICDGHRISTKRMPHPTRKGILVNLTACTGCEWTGNGDASHREHVAHLIVDALRPTVDTEGQLAELPDMAVVRSKHGVVWERYKDADGARDYWLQIGANREGFPSLPASVIYMPEAGA